MRLSIIYIKVIMFKRMKKSVRIFILLIILAFSFTLFAFSRPTNDVISARYENVATNGSFEICTGNSGDSAVFRFETETEINTVVLKESGNTITSFRIYADGEETPIYGNDYIGGYRYCAFETKEVSSLRIEVLSSDSKWVLTSLEAYLIENRPDDFEVMSYINVDTAYLLSSKYAETASHVTQFNVFGAVFFDVNADLYIADYELNETKINGKALLSQAIANIRAINPSAKIVLTVLGNRDFGDGADTRDRHNSAMGTHGNKLTANLLALLEEYDADGVSFDYEYPEKKSDFRTFADYIKSLDRALGDKLLTAAISEWCIGWNRFSASDFDPLDSIEIMAYDLFDERGNHSTFYSAYSVVTNLIDKGVDMKKVHLGLPFYSRPINGDTYWGLYHEIAYELSPYENTVNEVYVNADGREIPSTPNYYNGRQMIYDKTRFALDAGLGGVMVWHFGCDSTDPELSLFAQIGAALGKD